MNSKQRLCIKAWSVTNSQGDHIELEAGKHYSTSETAENGEYILLPNMWARVPVSCFMS